MAQDHGINRSQILHQSLGYEDEVQIYFLLKTKYINQKFKRVETDYLFIIFFIFLIETDYFDPNLTLKDVDFDCKAGYQTR